MRCVCARGGASCGVCVCVNVCRCVSVLSCVLSFTSCFAHTSKIWPVVEPAQEWLPAQRLGRHGARMFYLPCDTRAAPEQCVCLTRLLWTAHSPARTDYLHVGRERDTA